MNTELRVLLLGQTPPPPTGQALMLEHLVHAPFARVRVFHVRMAFSSTTRSIGRVELRKLLHLVAVVVRVAYVRFRHGTTMLLFPPAGPNRTPVVRDVILLLLLRPLFPHVVFTFHAAGVSDFLASCPRLLRALANRAYARPDGAIILSSLLPPDAQRFHAGRIAVIHNGIPDDAGNEALPRELGNPVRILFVGLLTESKGVLVLLAAARRLLMSAPSATSATSATKFEIVFMGEFASPEFEEKTRDVCRTSGLADVVRFVGSIPGPRRWEHFRAADILCLPTHYESEALPLVIIEAMMHRLPVVATRWRGIPDLVDDGTTGILVPTEDPDELATALQRLIDQPALRAEMGERARLRFLERFTLDAHLRQTEAFLLAVARDHPRA